MPGAGFGSHSDGVLEFSCLCGVFDADFALRLLEPLDLLMVLVQLGAAALRCSQDSLIAAATGER
jgi:hypothetical protein